MPSDDRRAVARRAPSRPAATAARLRWWSRVLDGAHPWGSVEAMVGCYGHRRFRLIVHPPGISKVDRRLARLWRAWPTAGSALTLLTVIVIGEAARSLTAVLVVAVAVFIAIGAVLSERAGPTRVAVRSVSVILLGGVHDEAERLRYAEWEALSDSLIDADQRLRSGSLTPAGHEAIWWEVYERLAR